MLKFVGDICFTDNHFDVGFGVGSFVKNGGNPFANFTKQDTDLWIGNFEGVAADSSQHSDYHKYCFRIAPEHLNHCRFIDYFSVANNHVMEHGPKAYKDMCHYLNQFSKGCFGSSKNKSIEFEHQGRKVSVTGFCLRVEDSKFSPLYWYCPEYIEILEESKNLNADFKIVYLHWGVEFVDHPSFEQQSFAHWLIEIGFDMVIGMHPHVMQGYEVYKDKYIFYSLGNFIFNMAYEPTNYSAVINVDIQNNLVSYDYVKIGENYSPMIIPVDSVPERYRFETLNSKLNIRTNVEDYIKEALCGLKQYRRSHHKSFLRNIFKFDFSIMKNIVVDFIKRRIKNGN